MSALWALAAPGVASARMPADGDRAPEPPFEAVVGDAPAAVRSDGEGFHIAGALTPGARVRIIGCTPDCVTTGSWLRLEGGGRVLRRSVELPPGAQESVGPRASPSLRLEWARVKERGVKVYAAPDPEAEVLLRPEQGATLALVDNPALERAGWRARRDGGAVPSDQVEPYVPVDFVGVEDPPGPVAFVLEPTRLVRPRDARGPEAVTRLPAFGHAPVLDADDDAWLEVEGGWWLPRRAARVAQPSERPAAIPARARWVHVDREQGVLTAYEGDHWVYAALVSVGTPHTWRHSDAGLFRVYAKHRHADMSMAGEYDVEAVPDVLFYNRGEALHGAFWHDDFGHPVSYGCINLSLSDARWLFTWAPPELPDTWSAVNPRPDEERLWVWVE